MPDRFGPRGVVAVFIPVQNSNMQPEYEMMRASEATHACDLFIAIGSSLVVFPAAGFPSVAKDQGASLVILNRDPTDMDGLADLVLNDEIGPTLAEAVGLSNSDMLPE